MPTDLTDAATLATFKGVRVWLIDSAQALSATKDATLVVPTVVALGGSCAAANTVCGGEATCTAKDPVSYLNNNTTNLKKDPVSQLWNLEVKWDLTCQVSGQSMDTSLYLQWTTGCVPDTTNYVPLADPNALTASYTRSSVWCSAAVGEVTVSWNFQQH